MELYSTDAAHAVCTVMAARDDDSGHTLVNIGSFIAPSGMKVETVGPHRFVAMRDLAYYAAHGRVRQDGD